MIFSLLRSSRAVGRSLALSPSFASRLVTSRALSVGAAGTPTPYVLALAPARARFFATTRSVEFAAAAEGEKTTTTTPKKKSSTTGTKKKTTTKTTAAKKKPVRKAVAKKKTTVGARKTKPAKKGRVTKAKPKKEERILKKDLRPPFKHPGSPWVNFYKEFIANRQGSGPVTVFISEASKLWKEMSDEAKQAYAPTREAVAEYSLKRREWFKSLPLKRRRMYAADHEKPAIKGLPSVYSQFTKENYATAPGDSFVEKGRSLKEKWDNMGDAEKDEFKQRIMRTRQEIKANSPPAEA